MHIYDTGNSVPLLCGTHTILKNIIYIACPAIYLCALPCFTATDYLSVSSNFWREVSHVCHWNLFGAGADGHGFACDRM